MRTISPATRPALLREVRALRERLVALSRGGSLRDPVSASCAGHDLTPPQIHAIVWLGHDGPLTMGELARRVSVTEKTITGIVDRLERDRLLGRERDPADRRVVRVRLTLRGAAIYRRIDRDIEDRMARLLGLLAPADRAALARIVDHLTAALAAAHPAREGARAARGAGSTAVRKHREEPS
jgi:DNA-binding MarR family transcriptional regulator